MYHHDGRDYHEAASAAAKVARTKLEETIRKGLAGAQALVTYVQDQVPEDRIARGRALKFVPHPQGGDGFALSVTGVETNTLHSHARGQVLQRAEVPTKFADTLTAKGNWGRQLLLDNLNQIYRNEDERFLIRSVGGEARGFLSDRFRRLDSRPLLDSFVGSCSELGLVPLQGWALDTKVKMRALLPRVFEPLDNEVLAFGLEWSNSDFGDGGHTVKLYTLRIWCTNLAVGEEVLRQVHLGKRLDDNITYSRQTLEADTKANTLALRDVVHHAIGPERVEAMLESVRQASSDEIKGRDVIVNRLKRLNLDKATTEKVADAFESPDVVNLPPGNTTYRLSNALSWVAQFKDLSPEKRLDLEQAAGQLLPKVGTAARVVEV